MKKFVLLLAIFALAASAQAQISIQWGNGNDDPSETYVYPYVDSDGSVVVGRYQAGSDQGSYDYYDTYPANRNPYAGAIGRHGRRFYYSD
ncbi:MAG: hypothetical protein QG577_79 [Thermodesulfobacteriota bacterium]|nr:hypothetical protein [Thermodesulfobacteriota bacterium]